jgi:hypothetical protein
MKIQRSALALGLLALIACAHTPGGVASSNIPLAPGSYDVLGEVEGRDCLYNLLMLVPFGTGNKVRDAISEALESKDGADALVNLSVDQYAQFWLLFSRHCTTVNATAVKIREPGAAMR